MKKNKNNFVLTGGVEERVVIDRTGQAPLLGEVSSTVLQGGVTALKTYSKDYDKPAVDILPSLPVFETEISDRYKSKPVLQQRNLKQERIDNSGANFERKYSQKKYMNNSLNSSEKNSLDFINTARSSINGFVQNKVKPVADNIYNSVDSLLVPSYYFALSTVPLYLSIINTKTHKVYENYTHVEEHLRDYVKQKIISQIGYDKLYDTKGVYISENSNVARALEQNIAVKNFIHQHADELLSGKVVSGSVSFKDFKLHNTFGKVDILYMYINVRGEIECDFGDTYEFNPNETDPLVKMGEKAQEIGVINPYFILAHVRISKELSDMYLSGNY